MRGWSCKEAGPVLGIPETKVSQAVFAKGAAFDKVARLMLANPLWTIVDLLVHMVRVSVKEPGLSKPGELADVSPRSGVRPSVPGGRGLSPDRGHSPERQTQS